MHSFSDILNRITNYARQNPFPGAPRELYEPCDYILTLGGKRLRPALALMAYELFDPEIEKALPVGWAVELFHNFSLIHDDIMDAAPLRRGMPTVHTKWNLTTGILSGDVMLIYAYQSLMSVGDRTTIPALIDVFNRVAIGVCEGQQMDMNFEQRDQVSIEEYIRMIELKTAVLLGGALEMGAIAAHAEPEAAHHLYEFGRLAGIAFQIQDDLLDTYGDPATFGKQVGGDILQNKKTFLVLKTLESASEADRLALQGWMQEETTSPAEKVAAVKDIFDRNHIPQLVSEIKQQYETMAFEQLEAINVPADRKAVLKGMVAELLHREK